MNNIIFSIVMPAYKKKFLKESISSILAQTYQDFEFIIVNDASPDNIKEVVDSFHDSRIQFKTNRNNIGGRNLVENWNHCIQFAHYDYIILATDDDIFESTYLQDAIDLLSKYPEVNILRTGVRLIDEYNNIRDYEYPLKEYMTCKEFTLLWSKGGLHSCISNYIFKRKELMSNGGFIDFPHAHYSDDATILAMSRNGIINTSKANFNFRISSISLSYSSNYKIALSQIQATESFMSWYMNHLNIVFGTQHNDFLKNNSYEFFRNRYKTMIGILISKIPLRKFHKTISVLYKAPQLYKKEKLLLFINNLINKIL
jgi:glycosyltransferase involved in cell wall biosynthesis